MRRTPAGSWRKPMWKIKSTRSRTEPRLTIKAILFCQKGDFYEGARQLSLIGLFNEMYFAALPGWAEQFTIFLSFGGQIVEQHSYELTLEIRDLTDKSVIFPATGIPLEWKDGHMRIDSCIVVPPLQIKHAGDYGIVVPADKQVIAL